MKRFIILTTIAIIALLGVILSQAFFKLHKVMKLNRYEYGILKEFNEEISFRGMLMMHAPQKRATAAVWFDQVELPKGLGQVELPAHQFACDGPQSFLVRGRSLGDSQ